MYLALYRKYRPNLFDKIVGQEHITRTLQNQIKNDQIGHAYLFCGSRGTGKTTTAKVFARAINCLNPKNGSPCGECEVCKALKENNAIDIIEIDAASNNGVEEIRDLRDKVKYPPTVGKYKVYIIDEVHMLTTSAFNALLKTLEEPPAHAVFILATTEVHKLPATILSRVLRFDFKLINTETIAHLITDIFAESKIKAEPTAVNLIAKAGQGSVRDALSIADMCASFANNDIKYQDVVEVLGISDSESIFNLGSAILQNRVADFFTEFTNLANAGKNLTVTANDLTKFFRDLLVIKTCGENFIDYTPEVLQKMKSLAEEITQDKLNRAMQAFSKIESEMKYSLNPQLLIETTALGLFDADVKKKLIMSLNSTQPELVIPVKAVSARSIWGKVLLEMRKSNLINIHSICIDIADVSIDKNKFTISVSKSINFETLKKEQNYRDLVDTFHKLGYNYDIALTYEPNNMKKDDKVKILSQILGCKVALFKR